MSTPSASTVLDSRPPDATLLVASCDRYADLWRPYFALLRKHWPVCPFPVALITEQAKPDLEGVRPLCLGRGLDWSSLLARALDQVNTPYVLLTLEDFFLRRTVDTGHVLSLLRDMHVNGVRMLRLVPRPGPVASRDGKREFGTLAPDAGYRVSTQATFWNVETLRGLLVPGESAWEFEVNGSQRSAELEGFAAVWKPCLPYGHHVIERGKWFPWDAARFQRLNIGVDLSARPVMTIGESVQWLIRKAAGTLVQGLGPLLGR